jgi:hypothetical protein
MFGISNASHASSFIKASTPLVLGRSFHPAVVTVVVVVAAGDFTTTHSGNGNRATPQYSYIRANHTSWGRFQGGL